MEYSHISLYEQFEKSAQEYSDIPAIDYYSADITYKALLKRINTAAAALNSLGVKEGEHIGIILPNIPEAVVLFYAANRIGAIADMIHPLSAVKEFEYYVRNSECRYVFAVDTVVPKITELASITEKVFIVSPSFSLPALMRIGYNIKQKEKYSLPAEFLQYKEFVKLGRQHDALLSLTTVPKADPTKACALLYTGGTTGKTKGVLLSSINFECIALEGIKSCGCLAPGDRMLAVLPVFHGFGLGVCIHTVMSFGGTSVMLPAFKLKNIMSLILKLKPAILAGVPSIYKTMIKGDNDSVDLSFIKCVLSGGDSLPPETQREFNAMLERRGAKVKIRQGYGLTECLSGTCLMPDGSDKENCLGLPYEDNLYKIVDVNSGKEVNPMEHGEILISSPTVMMGYFKESEETKNVLEKDEDGKIWLHTGDMGYMDEEGYVYFVSRIKRMIISNGYNIYPNVIEDVIRANPNCEDVVVVGVPNDLKGEIARAYIVMKSGVEDKSAALRDIRQDCENSISRFSLPREYEIIDSIPLTDIGKISYRDFEK